MTLACRDFIKKDGQQVVGIRCKMCGEPIAGITERVKGDPKLDKSGNRIVTKVERWTRFHSFTELKMALADGSFHITTGCDKCLTHNLTKDDLRDLMQADIEEQRSDLGKLLADRLAARVPLTIVGVKLGGGIT